MISVHAKWMETRWSMSIYMYFENNEYFRVILKKVLENVLILRAIIKCKILKVGTVGY